MKPQPAFAEEEDPKTGEAVLGTENSASFSSLPEQSSKRRKIWRNSESNFTSDSESLHLGLLLDVLKQPKQDALLTIVAGEHDDNEEVWKECEKSGGKFRLFPLKGSKIRSPCLMYATLNS